jgi:glycosyltransferase involved in cell wall biosynthesis
MRAAALTKQEARFALGLPQYEKIIGAVGRLDRVKRWDLALYGVPESAGIAFMGNGTEHDRLWRRARRIGVRAHFLSPRIDAWAYLRAFDILALPSRAEGRPLIVLEAAALGVPILCSDIPAHRELLGVNNPYLVKLDYDWNAKMTQALGPHKQPCVVGRDLAEYGRMIMSHDYLYRSLVV